VILPTHLAFASVLYLGGATLVDTYNPATYRGGVLQLHYARAAELEPWLDLVAIRGEVVVQFWLKARRDGGDPGGGGGAGGGADSGAVAAVFVMDSNQRRCMTSNSAPAAFNRPLHLSDHSS